MVCIKLNHIDSNGFDYVAHVTRRVPERLKRLRLPDAVGGLDLQFPRPRALRREGDLPRAKRIFAEVRAQLCFAPGFPPSSENKTSRMPSPPSKAMPLTTVV